MLVASVSMLLGEVIRKIGKPTVVSDRELLQRYNQQRSESAFEELMHRHGPLVWGVCQRMLSHRQDAEDAFQATFMVLARKSKTVYRPERLGHWLYGVACYAASNVRKCRQRRKGREQPWGETLDVPDYRHALWNEVSPLVDEELNRLPAKYRLPLVLCCIEGMTHQEAAQLLKWPVGTVAGRASRGREMLRKRLLQRGVMVSPALMLAFLTPDVMASGVPTTVVSSCMGSIFASTTVGLAGHVLSPMVSSAVAGTVRQLFLARLATFAVGLIAFVIISSGIVLGWRSVPQEAPAVVEGTPIVAALPQANARFVKLPGDPNAVVLSWRQTDLAGSRTNTSLSIKADGRIVGELRPASGERVIKLEEKLTGAELQQLMQFAVHDQAFLSFNANKAWDALLAEYDFEGDMREPRDTTLTEIAVRTANREHRVEWYQLSSTEAWFHEVKAIKQLVQLHRQLQNKMLVMQAGGTEKVNAIAQPLTELLRKTYPQLPAFEARHLTYIAAAENGGADRWTFGHGAKFGDRRFFSATCELSEDGRIYLTAVTPGPADKSPTMKKRHANETSK